MLSYLLRGPSTTRPSTRCARSGRSAQDDNAELSLAGPSTTRLRRSAQDDKVRSLRMTMLSYLLRVLRLRASGAPLRMTRCARSG